MRRVIVLVYETLRGGDGWGLGRRRERENVQEKTIKEVFDKEEAMKNIQNALILYSELNSFFLLDSDLKFIPWSKLLSNASLRAQRLSAYSLMRRKQRMERRSLMRQRDERFVHKTAATGLQSKGEKHWRGHCFGTTGGHKAKAKLLLLLLEMFY